VTEARRLLLSGNEAVAQAARDARVALGTGYPGTPSTEILEHFAALGGRAQWAPNEKVALEVALGAAFATAPALVTMKHVGLNVAADPLFTAAYTGTPGPLVVVSADDPGMWSSQNEQDNRRYAVAAGVPMLEPSDSQEAYDFTQAALRLSVRWHLPVLLRMTTRVCHSKGVVRADQAQTQGAGDCPDFRVNENGTVPLDAGTSSRSTEFGTAPAIAQSRLQDGNGRGFVFRRDIRGHVMIPGNARPAHRRLRAKLAEIAQFSEIAPLHALVEGSRELGIVTSGISFMYVREAAPKASVLKLGLTYPLPLARIRTFAQGVERCVVIEEGDPYLVEQVRAAGIHVEGKPEMYRFGELDVGRVRRILAGDVSPEALPTPGKPPALCSGCPYRTTFAVLRKLDCIVPGDIGCYSLGALPPLEAMDSLVCMGAGIGMGLGLRHVLPVDQARRVVSIIGDSTFIHSGIPGLVEMVYNPPSTGHVVLILDNGTTAMTGFQEHPGTGRTLEHQPAGKVVLEDLVRGLGVERVMVLDPSAQPDRLEALLRESLDRDELTVMILRRTCLLAVGRIRQYEKGGSSDR